MEKIYQIVSKLNFKSFCSEITQQSESSVIFKLKYSYHDNHVEEILCIQEVNGAVILSDNGSTFSNLDDIFELKEPDTRKNIIAVLKHFNIQPDDGNMFTCRIDLSKDMIPQILRFLQGIHFLYAMKLFYI